MKERIDLLLVQRGYYPSREKARAALMAGLVFVNKQICDKAGTKVADDADIQVKNDLCPYVGRGGLKLAKALDVFSLDLMGAVCVDIGASTGGFTDCMLQNGAARVYAVDVGYGQLDYKLRMDRRVVNMEKQNIRYLSPSAIPEPADFISCDVSFISLNLVFPVAVLLMKPGSPLVSLVKPQFEAGREQVGKHGIVRDKSIHMEVLSKVASYGQACGLMPEAVSFSPMTGAKGNIEYLMLFRNPEDDEDNEEIEGLFDEVCETVVEEAHKELM